MLVKFALVTLAAATVLVVDIVDRLLILTCEREWWKTEKNDGRHLSGSHCEWSKVLKGAVKDG